MPLAALALPRPAAAALLAASLCLPAGAERLHALQQQPTTVRLLMVRHGQSCANIISDYGSTLMDRYQHKNYPDPLLTDCGAERSRAAYERILRSERVDFIGSSPLSRAMETAWLQFGAGPERPVHVLPHVGEEAHGATGALVRLAKVTGIIDDADNQPLPRETQLANFRAAGYEDVPVDFTYADLDGDYPSSWKHFEEFLATRLLPSLDLQGKEEYTLGIASHSLFLKASLGKDPAGGGGLFDFGGSKPLPREGLCWGALPRQPGGGRVKPHNNQVLELFYRYDAAAGSLELDVERGCRSLGVAEGLPSGVPSKPQNICEADFNRCMAGWPKVKDPQNTTNFNREIQLQEGKPEDVESIKPAECVSHHECDGFPKIATVEQSWIDNWRAAKERSLCKGKECLKFPLPPLPDLQAACSCASP